MKRSTDNLKHTRWECKYHVVFIPKYRKRSIYGWIRRAWTDHPGTCAAEREHSGGGASDGGPCSHAVVDTTEVLGFWGGGVHKREECDRDSAQLHGASEEFCRAEFLGAGVLRVNSGAG